MTERYLIFAVSGNVGEAMRGRVGVTSITLVPPLTAKTSE